MAGGSRKQKGKKTNHHKSSHRSCNQQVSLNVTNRDTEDVNHDTEEGDGLEKTLFEKVELQYVKAFETLLDLNYPEEVAFKAMKTNGCIYGPSLAISDNIVRNTISYIETGNVIDKNLCSNEGGEPKPIMNMKELVNYSMQALVNKVAKNKPISESIKVLLSDNRFFECEDETERLINESSDALRKMKINGSPPSMDQPQVATPDNKLITDLVNKIKTLEEDLKVEKQRSEERVMKAAKMLSHERLELSKLRAEKCRDTEVADKVDKLKRINHEIARIKGKMMDLNISNADFKSRIAAYNLCQSEDQSKLRLVKKKQKKSLKLLSNNEKKVCELKRMIEEEKHQISQLEENLLQAAEAEKQAKMRLMLEVEAKKQARLLFLEADRLNREAKQELELHLVTVQQELDANKQWYMNEVENRKNLLSLLQEQHCDDLMMDIKKRSTIKHLCMICRTNTVNVIFLPCKHEVICQHCNDFNAFDSSLKAAGCPCCKFGIEKTIRFYF